MGFREGLAIAAIVLLMAFAWPTSASAAPVLRSADIRMVIRSADACEVTMTLAVEGGGPIDHRIEAREDSQITLGAVRGARQVSEPRTVGRTLSLVLETTTSEYSLSYSVQQPRAQNRCPLWVPAAPADGVSRGVRINVELPPGMTAGGTMPAFTWNRPIGTTTLAHIPAFVRVPFAPEGESTIWDVSTAMDALAILVFAAASGIWMWRRRR
jgi:hypothetical protein